MKRHNIYSLCEGHFQSFGERCLNSSESSVKRQECERTYAFLAECVSIATLNCCTEEAHNFRKICDATHEGEWQSTQSCGKAAHQVARCMSGTFGIKEQIDLQSVEDRDFDRHLRGEDESTHGAATLTTH